MLHVHDLQAGLPIFKCLGSPLRISIIQMLQSNGAMSMGEIANALSITGGALTPHMKQLADCGLVSISSSSGKHGLMRICTANECRIMIDPIHDGRNPDA